MDAVVGVALEQPRVLTLVLGFFASAALALAALGIYGLLSYAVAERQQELSIRLALGARPGGVRWMVVRDGMLIDYPYFDLGGHRVWGATAMMLGEFACLFDGNHCPPGRP